MQSFPTYNFQNITVEEILKEAFEQCGEIFDSVNGLEKESAKRSLNFMFSEWVNLGLNLFTVNNAIIPLVLGQNEYSLPSGLIDITEMTCSQFTRMLGGTAFSSAGGNANNCFDGDSSSGCLQTAPNGNISYNYGPGTQNQIYYVGIQSNANETYTLAFEYSLDDDNWTTAFLSSPTYYPVGRQIWYVLPVSAAANVWRIRETGGNTLNIQEIYFNQPSNSYMLKRMSREMYTSISNKTMQGGLGSWYLDKTKVPTLFMWPTPDLSFPFLVYNYMSDIPDVLRFTDTLYVPKRFMKAVAYGLSALIADKFYKDQFPIRDQIAKEAYTNAAVEDSERADMHIWVDCTSYFS